MGQAGRFEKTSSDQVTSGGSHGPVGRLTGVKERRYGPATGPHTGRIRPAANRWLHIYELALITSASVPRSSSARNAPAAWRFVSIGRFSFPAGTIAEQIGRRQE